MAVTLEQATSLVLGQAKLFDRSGHAIGSLAQIYIDEETDQPVWAAVVFAPPSDVETVAPIQHAQVVDSDLHLTCDRQLVASAPRVRAGDELPWIEEERLRSHYGEHSPSTEHTHLTPLEELS